MPIFLSGQAEIFMFPAGHASAMGAEGLGRYTLVFEGSEGGLIPR